jgi:alpha-tubulin suppressor-like RCC1 family protein
MSLLRAAVLLAAVAVVAGPLAAAPHAGGVASAIAVSTASDHACALLSDRTVRCWGQNDQGQLGDGTTTPRLTAVAVRGLSNVIDVSAVWPYTCAVVDGGSGSGPVKCWGASNKWTGNGPSNRSLVPITVGGITDAVAVTAGSGSTCALLADHTVECWGDNSLGELGNGTRASSSTPVVVPGLSGVQAINAGDGSVCAVMQNSTVRCWGSAGEYEPDVPNDVLTPTPVPGLTGAVSVSADPYTSCAVLQGGTVECWAMSANTGTPAFTPVAVPGLSAVKAYAYTRDGQQTEHSCALLVSGSVECRSPNPYEGQTGNGTTKPNGDKLVTVSGLRDVTMISAAGFYTCAVRSTGSVECWGGNEEGVLGSGTTMNSSTPVTVSWSAPAPGFGLRGAIDLALHGGTVHGYRASLGGQVGTPGTSSDLLTLALTKTIGGITQSHAWTVKLAAGEITIDRSKASIVVNDPLGTGTNGGQLHFTFTGRPRSKNVPCGYNHVAVGTLHGTIRISVGDHFFKTITLTRMTGNASTYSKVCLAPCPRDYFAQGSGRYSPSKPLIGLEAATRAGPRDPPRVDVSVFDPTAGTPFEQITHELEAVGNFYSSSPNLTSATVSTPGGVLSGRLRLRDSGPRRTTGEVGCRGGHARVTSRSAMVTSGRITAMFDSIGKVSVGTNLNTPLPHGLPALTSLSHVS